MNYLKLCAAIAMLWALLFATSPISAAPSEPLPENPANQIHGSAADTAVWGELQSALKAFNNGGSRAEFLATCKRLLAAYPQSDYTPVLTSLIDPMAREAALPSPAWLAKDRYQRTPEERIQALIFQLRDVGAGTRLADGVDEPPMEAIVKIGPAAIPFLIDALSDDTPTRVVTYQREFYPYWFVLRREDLALSCLESIADVRFYDPAATFLHFYIDSPERRQSVLSDIHAWWAESQGKPQAQMIRNQIALMPGNVTLRSYDHINALAALGLIEGPEAVEPELKQLFQQDTGELNSDTQAALSVFDPSVPVQAAFSRFAADKALPGDYLWLYQYGDRRTYAELARRMEAAGHLLPAEWGGSDEVEHAADLGQNWAIPIVAFALKDDAMTGSRDDSTGWGRFATADVAVVTLGKLTGQDFGYNGFAHEPERLQKIHAARAWWEATGRTATRALVARDHSSVSARGDLFDTDAVIQARVAAITGSDPAKRRQAIAPLSEVYSPRVQRALLTALPKEKDPRTRQRMLLLLQTHALVWEIEPLAELFAHDPDLACRLLAGDLIATLPANPYQVEGIRLENRERALATISHAAEGSRVPPSVRAVADSILNSDRPLAAGYGWAGGF